jgi:hypothetical protein
MNPLDGGVANTFGFSAFDRVFVEYCSNHNARSAPAGKVN